MIWAKKNDLVQARVEFEIAKKKGMLSNALEKNLNYVQENLGLKKVEEAQGLLDQGHALMQAIPFSMFLAFSLVAALIVSFVNRKNLFKTKNFIAVALVFVPTLFSFWYSKSFESSIALKEEKLWEGPSQIYQQTTAIPKGLKVIIQRYPDGWVKIVSPSNFWGWTRAENIAVLGDK